MFFCMICSFWGIYCYKKCFLYSQSKGKFDTKFHIETEIDSYSPKLFSENNEEIIIRHFFKDMKNGFFVDVGSYHYKDKSNTYYLEKYLNWSGIAVDANSEFADGYKKYRPRTKFFSYFVSDKSGEIVTFYIVNDKSKSRSDCSSIKGFHHEMVNVPSITLNELLEKSGVKKIDLLTMDIELSEPAALKGFDIKKYRPELVCIEAHKETRDEILKYFENNGYKRLDIYFLYDKRNWYFVEHDKYKKMLINY